MLVGTDALHRAHRARPEPRPGAVRDAEIHRRADQRDIEAGEKVVESLRREPRADERRRISEGPFAPVAVLELRSRHARKLGIGDVAALAVGEPRAQQREFLSVDHSGLATVGSRLFAGFGSPIKRLAAARRRRSALWGVWSGREPGGRVRLSPRRLSCSRSRGRENRAGLRGCRSGSRWRSGRPCCRWRQHCRFRRR